MTREQFREFTKNKIVILDGAMGSNLQKNGMPASVCPEQWMLDNKEIVISLQSDYLKSGTDILYAPTFTCSRIKLREYGLEDAVVSFNAGLLELSKEAVNRYRADMGDMQREIYIAGNLTMTGKQLYPIGTLEFEDLVTVYKEQINVLVNSGADLIAVETMMSLQECRAALIASKECTDLPVMVTMTFNDNGKTLYGTDPKTAVLVLENLGAAAVGVNCSTGPEDMHRIIREMREYAGIPIIAKPNAGIPILVDNKTVFKMGAKEFAEKTAELALEGAGILGGCCGTTPEHIKELSNTVKNMQSPVVSPKKIRALTTEYRTSEIKTEGRILIVGERINPTGKKALQEELKNNKFNLVCSMAEEQEENGADILDINMGMNGINEKETMLKAIYEVLAVTDLPLSIDSSHVDVIEAALRIYPGRALINSISLEKEKFERLIPIAKKYGAMFILLPLSEQGLPKNIEEKKDIIKRIIAEAKAHGLTEEDIIVDGLVNTVGANKEAANQTLETIRFCKNELGVATICGLSNISFGLPERQFINAAFLAFCIKEGMTMAIANPSQDLLMNMAYASDLLLNKEEADIRYIERVSKSQFIIEKTSAKLKSEDSTIQSKALSAVYEDVLKGSRNNIIEHVKEELDKQVSASDILNNILIPAINDVGRLFEEKKYFLPQLIASAEAMKVAAEYLKPILSDANEEKSLGNIVIATVEGDIHDIGKNLVALMLRNYGFKVIDLGKDVKSEDIIKAAMEHKADIIALSALMTTTMVEMREVVRLKNEYKLPVKIMIGGAVITQSYCDDIGADGYSKDANEAVEVAKRLI